MVQISDAMQDTHSNRQSKQTESYGSKWFEDTYNTQANIMKILR